MLEQRVMRLAMEVLKRAFNDLSENGAMDRRQLHPIRDALQRHWPSKQNRVLSEMLPKKAVEFDQFREFILGVCLSGFARLEPAKDAGLNEAQLRPVTRSFGQDHELTIRAAYNMLADGDKKARDRHRPATWRVSSEEFPAFVLACCSVDWKSGDRNKTGQDLLDGITMLVAASAVPPAPEPRNREPEHPVGTRARVALTALFKELDQDANGAIEAEELADLTAALRQQMPHVELPREWCSFEEFTSLVLRSLGRVFNALDVDGSGELNSDELLKVSSAFERDHDELVHSFQARQKWYNKALGRWQCQVSLDEFEGFVLLECAKGMRARHVPAALARMLFMTTQPAPTPAPAPAPAPAPTPAPAPVPVSYTHLRAHETPEHLVCRLLLEKKKKKKTKR
eukprot:TRINITY_DN2690_c0_g3_i1.p1 TRINITY_DN2690_c0_g3~~TRINITY_DN2690_c0_g3_i1.p1  ORF type:complete len:398 (+),score=76.34 TRINITY_DN2690_c0_g3_i1:123-1316(+)